MQFVILPSIVSVSLGGARERAKDARIVADMSQIRATAEIIYLDEGDSYGMISCTHPEIASMCRDIKTQGGEEPIIHSTQKDYLFILSYFREITIA